MTKTLFHCPYGHDGEFTHEETKVRAPDLEMTRVVCSTCGRSFVQERLRINIYSGWDSRLVDISFTDKAYEEPTNVSADKSTRVDATFAGRPIRGHTFWSGQHLEFITREE